MQTMLRAEEGKERLIMNRVYMYTIITPKPSATSSAHWMDGDITTGYVDSPCLPKIGRAHV